MKCLLIPSLNMCVSETMPHAQRTVCDNNSAQLSCDNGYYLQIKSAFYGRQDPSTCSSNQVRIFNI